MAQSPCDLPATTLQKRLRARRLSAVELMRACLARIAALDPLLRAFVTVDAEGALAAAARADALAARGGALPTLHGMPVAIKDMTATAGLRTTQGSPVFFDHVPEADAASVARLRAAGAIVIGKTNTPAFAFGAVCTNPLCGPTANPWDLALSSAGSSGGSAVAVATGMVPFAQGTDFGGSVRTPASFCGVVGLRPEPGTVAEPERPLGRAGLSTQGVLARSVGDALLLLRAMAGPHPLDPLSQGVRPVLRPLTKGPAPRLAATPDFGGALRIDSGVRARFAEACRAVTAIAGPVTDASPDVTGGTEAFHTLRAVESWWRHGALVAQRPEDLPEAFVWNVGAGRGIPAEAMIAAEADRTRVWRHFVRFFEDHDLLLLPAASVLPFRNDAGEVTGIEGQPTETIIDYLACTYLVSLVGFPALSLPAPQPAGALPFGLQIVAPPGREGLLWAFAARLEAAGFAYRPSPIVAQLRR
jgi:amidase